MSKLQSTQTIKQTEWQETTGADGGYCKNWANTVECEDQKHVIDIKLVERQLGGVLPKGPVLAKLPELQFLTINGSGLTGTLPDDWGILKDLSYLDLSKNKLQGTYPPGWGKMENMFGMFLQDTPGLHGQMPPTWCSGMPLLDHSFGSCGWVCACCMCTEGDSDKRVQCTKG